MSANDLYVESWLTSSFRSWILLISRNSQKSGLSNLRSYISPNEYPVVMENPTSAVRHVTGTYYYDTIAVKFNFLQNMRNRYFTMRSLYN